MLHPTHHCLYISTLPVLCLGFPLIAAFAISLDMISDARSVQQQVRKPKDPQKDVADLQMVLRFKNGHALKCRSASYAPTAVEALYWITEDNVIRSMVDKPKLKL